MWFSDTYIRTPSGWRYAFAQASLPLPQNSRRQGAAGAEFLGMVTDALGSCPDSGIGVLLERDVNVALVKPKMLERFSSE